MFHDLLFLKISFEKRERGIVTLGLWQPYLGCSEPSMTERYTGDSVAQLLQQVNYFHGLSHCQLSQIGAAAVTTLGIFEID